MKKFGIGAIFAVVALCAYEFKSLYDIGNRNPDLLLMAASQDSQRGRLVRLYINELARIDWNRTSEYGELPLNMLIANCDPWTSACEQTAEILLSQGADINSRSKNRVAMAPLHIALGNPAAVKFLLDHGADPNRTVEGDNHFTGLTAVQLAEKFKVRPNEVIHLLISKGGR